MSEALRILLIEDSETDAKLLLHELRRCRRTIEHERVETEQAVRTALSRKDWDLVMSDWSMPTFSAAGALAVVKEVNPHLPFIIVSGTIGEETAVEAMRSGADDFVLKDRLGRLVPAVERALRESAERQARLRAEKARQESEARFRTLADSGIIGIIVADVEGAIREANDAYLNLVGHSRAELLDGALRWDRLTPSELADRGERAFRQLKATGVASAFETETFRKDGTRVPILVGMATLEYPTCIAFIADLTERKEAEAGRRRAEKALRETEEQLRQSQKMEAIGRLAGGVAHDFNNMLSVILGYSSLILQDLSATDPLREDLQQISKAAESAAALTRQLLLFSQKHVVEAQVIDLHGLLAGMDRMLQRILGEDVELVMVAPSLPGRIEANPSNIEQIILNLVVNARDAMPQGGKLTIESCNVSLDGDYAATHLPAVPGAYVMLAVSDTGVGMDRETQSRIFEPFFTTKGVGKGTGLGLSTVFGIVQQTGGHIWVYSEPGLGTTFKVYLPRIDAEVTSGLTRTSPATSAGTETILLVEDDDQVRSIALNILRRQGYHVIPARDPGEALLLCEKRTAAIDLLLTDVVMPFMSGPELARRLYEMWPEKLRILCMSGYTDDSIVRHGFLQETAFIQKPFTALSLARKVREVLDQPSTASHR